MTPPPSTAISPLLLLAVRVLMVVWLFVSLILIITTSTPNCSNGSKIKFNDYYAYRDMAPPPSTANSPVVMLAVRVLTFVCLLVSFHLITTNTASLSSSDDYDDGSKIKFNDYYAYRYLVHTIVALGLSYTLLQTSFSIFQVTTGNRIIEGDDFLLFFDFYCDKVVSYLIAIGAAGCFGMTREFKRGDPTKKMDKFLNKEIAAASLCFIAFLFAAVSSIFSSYALPKRSSLIINSSLHGII